MKTLKIISLIVLVPMLMACTFSVNVPSVKTGVTQTFEINEEPVSNADVSLVNIEMGAGSLDLSGGTDKLVEGTIVYNIDSWKPEVIRQANSLTVKQTTSASISLPGDEYKNSWDLKLGPMPIELNLTTGAYEGDLELGGLAITRLTVSDGASKSTIRFSEPNTTEMSLFTYKTGASNIELYGLGNAAASRIEFDSGVGSYTLEFSGENKEDTSVAINSGMSDIKIIIPENVRAEITVDGEMSNTDLAGTWTVENNIYKAGTSGALISIQIDMSVGNLNLIQE